MRRCLIVANQTLEFERLAAAVQQRIDKEEHTFYVAVPATPLKDQATGVGVAGTEGASPQNLAMPSPSSDWIKRSTRSAQTAPKPTVRSATQTRSRWSAQP